MSQLKFKKQHGGSRPPTRKDDKRLKLKFKKQILIIDATDEEIEKIRGLFPSTRERTIKLLSLQ